MASEQATPKKQTKNNIQRNKKQNITKQTQKRIESRGEEGYGLGAVFNKNNTYKK